MLMLGFTVNWPDKPLFSMLQWKSNSPWLVSLARYIRMVLGMITEQIRDWRIAGMDKLICSDVRYWATVMRMQWVPNMTQKLMYLYLLLDTSASYQECEANTDIGTWHSEIIIGDIYQVINILNRMDQYGFKYGLPTWCIGSCTCCCFGVEVCSKPIHTHRNPSWKIKRANCNHTRLTVAAHWR